MRYTYTLKHNSDFRRLYSKGKSFGAGTMVIYCRKNREDTNRIGYTVSTKIGKAVTRNKIRRRMREIYRLSEASFKRGWDIVVVARHRSASASYSELEADFRYIVGRLGLLEENK